MWATEVGAGLDEEKQTFSTRFKLGIVLIAGSLICGYASLAVLRGAAGTGKTGLRNFSLAIWFLTWIPFLAGFALSGKEGVRQAMWLIRRQFGESEWFLALEQFLADRIAGLKERLQRARVLIKEFLLWFFGE
ncbi:MAG: hypothetical protein V3V54_03650 [Candidatus Brocadiales bacterium]